MIFNKVKKIYQLWRLLDNIDTASDVFKNDYEGFAKYVYKIQRQRWEILNENQVEKIYDKFFEWDKE